MNRLCDRCNNAATTTVEDKPYCHIHAIEVEAAFHAKAITDNEKTRLTGYKEEDGQTSD